VNEGGLQVEDEASVWRSLVARGAPPLLVPGVWDGFSARVATNAGFKALLIGGYHVGAAVGSVEPLLSAEELVTTCRHVRRATTLPVRVDIGAGFGDPMHVAHVVTDLMSVGIRAVSMEDQVYPKQAHYHNDYREQLISLDAMVHKIRWARRTGGESLYLNARTDAFAMHGLDEVAARCNAFLEAGADAVQAFPSSPDDVAALPQLVDGPVWYSNTRGNRVGRPTLTPRQAHELGYAAVGDGHALFFAAFEGMRDAIERHSAADGLPVGAYEIGTKKRIEGILDLEALYRIEAETILADGDGSGTGGPADR
jgi:methylisocitrate lyase